MLLSPGHSPRNLSTPEPIREQTPIPGDNPNRSLSSSGETRKRSRSSPKVLDEDSYVAAIDKIIERDYFPDIPKLRDRLDWLQATRTRDPVLIRDAQLKILERRRRLNRGGSTSAAASSVAPAGTSSLFRNSSVTPSLFRNSSVTPSLYGNGVGRDGEQVTDGGGGVQGEIDVDVESLSLDEFLRKYTSEDNESFSRIIEKVNRKKKEKYAFLLENGNDNMLIENGENSKREAVPTDGYGTSNQPTATLLGWKYTPKNSLMYHPSDGGELPLTEEEKALRLKAQTKEISKPNTRFHGKAKDPDAMLADGDEDGSAAVLYTTIAGSTPIPMPRRDDDKAKKYDLEELKKTPNRFYVDSNKKAENGYSFVRTPSPAPGLDESPFITWGEIDGTPLRLEAEDTPFDIGGSGDGPQFKIQMPPSRDVKAHSLSREASRKLRERSKMFQKPPLPSPMRGGSASPARILSPAAQKFMRNAIAKSSRSIDESLRASYRSASPGHGTPKGGRSMSRLGRDGSPGIRSPSVNDASNAPW